MASTSSARAAGFDRHITVFSPEGRLFQVEYAFKAVLNAEPQVCSVGVKSAAGVVLASPRRAVDPMHDIASVQHVFRLAPHIGAVMTGRRSDALALVHKCRQEACEYEYRYGVPVPPESLARRVANLNQVATQEASVRPLGVSATIGGVEDDGTVALYRCDPAGYYVGYRAVATGAKSAEVMAAFERELAHLHDGDEEEEDDGTAGDINATVEFAVRTLQSALRVQFKAEELEVGYVGRSDRCFRSLSTAEVQSLLEALKK